MRRLRPQPAQSPWAGWWWKAPILLFVLWLIWPRSGPAGLPSCEASTTHELVRQAIENADDRRQVHRRLLAFDGIRELSFDAAQHDRACIGSAVLNGGERQIVWRVYQRGDQILVSVSGF